MPKGHSLNWYTLGRKIRGTSLTGRRYTYKLAALPGKKMDTRFNPYYTPSQMLERGVFEGKYVNDCRGELPKEWFTRATRKGKLCPGKADPAVNMFKIKSRLPLSEWRKAGWVPTEGAKQDLRKTMRARDRFLSNLDTNPDERGWFQWYTRYWLGRRIPELDRIQINRWRSFARHAGAIKANCKKGDFSCRPRERQALLQWAYDPKI